VPSSGCRWKSTSLHPLCSQTWFPIGRRRRSVPLAERRFSLRSRFGVSSMMGPNGESGCFFRRPFLFRRKASPASVFLSHWLSPFGALTPFFGRRTSVSATQLQEDVSSGELDPLRRRETRILPRAFRLKGRQGGVPGAGRSLSRSQKGRRTSVSVSTTSGTARRRCVDGTFCFLFARTRFERVLWLRLQLNSFFLLFFVA
jgi:hypothetical protein